jgi:replicative DNA helicase
MTDYDFPPPVVIPFAATLSDAIDAAEEAFTSDSRIGSDISTGLVRLDRMIGGIARGDYILACAGLDFDLSDFAIHVATPADRNPKTGAFLHSPPESLYVSLATSRKRIQERMLARLSGVMPGTLHTGSLTPEDFQRFSEAVGRRPPGPSLLDCAGIDTEGLRQAVRDVCQASPGIGLVVVDRIDMIRFPATSHRPAVLREVSRTLKEIAKENNVALVGLAVLPDYQGGCPGIEDLIAVQYSVTEPDVILSFGNESFYLMRAEPARKAGESDDAFNNRYQRWQQRLGEVHATCVITVLLSVAYQRQSYYTHQYFYYSGGQLGDLDDPG